jgi:hypothetical protein
LLKKDEDNVGCGMGGGGRKESLSDHILCCWFQHGCLYDDFMVLWFWWMDGRFMEEEPLIIIGEPAD